MTAGDRLATAARALVGVRFRAHGRDPESGLDCVGLLARALADAGFDGALPRDYRLHQRDAARVFAEAGHFGFAPVGRPEAIGDVALFRVGAVQVHFAILAETRPPRFVHAHAGLGRVVCGPLPDAWDAMGAWRKTPDPAIAAKG